MNLNPFKQIKNIPSAEELVQQITTRVRKISIKGTSKNVPPILRSRRAEAKRVENFAMLIRDKMQLIFLQFPSIDDLHPFYREMIKLKASEKKYKNTLSSLSDTSNRVWSESRKYVSLIWRSKDTKRMVYLRKQALNRLEMIVLKAQIILETLEHLRLEMKSLPNFSLSWPILCVAGYPNVGKSSFVKSATNAKPDVASYPFTTKKIQFGIYSPLDEENGSLEPLNYLIRYQLVDTPGILDRPLKSRNEIEKRAIIALSNLSSAILFLFDSYEHSTLDPQICLLKEIQQTLKPKEIYVGISKADLTSKIKLEEASVIIQQEFHLNPYFFDTRKRNSVRNWLLKISQQSIQQKMADS